MGERTQVARVKSVKISIFALVVLGVSLLSSLGYSRPASAEGFLQKTVQCVLSILVPYDCRPATSTPAAPAPTTTPAPSSAPATQTPSNTGTTGSSASSTGGSVSSSPSNTPPTMPSEGVDYMTPPAFLRTEELKAVEKAPELPAAVHNRSFSYEPMAYLAYTYGVKGASTTGAASDGEVIESTANGWHILGVEWYWWLVGLAAIAAVVIWLRKAKHKQSLSLVKQG